MPLGVEVDQQHPLALVGEEGRGVHRQGGLAGATLLVDERDAPGGSHGALGQPFFSSNWSTFASTFDSSRSRSSTFVAEDLQVAGGGQVHRAERRAQALVERALGRERARDDRLHRRHEALVRRAAAGRACRRVPRRSRTSFFIIGLFLSMGARMLILGAEAVKVVAKGLERLTCRCSTRRLVVVTGKGGVGKSSISAALALASASAGCARWCARSTPTSASPRCWASPPAAPRSPRWRRTSGRVDVRPQEAMREYALMILQVRDHLQRGLREPPGALLPALHARRSRSW